MEFYRFRNDESSLSPSEPAETTSTKTCDSATMWLHCSVMFTAIQSESTNGPNGLIVPLVKVKLLVFICFTNFSKL